jgi:hypothetical protein
MNDSLSTPSDQEKILADFVAALERILRGSASNVRPMSAFAVGAAQGR